jgi:hypothetical protein
MSPVLALVMAQTFREIGAFLARLSLPHAFARIAEGQLAKLWQRVFKTKNAPDAHDGDSG